MKRKSISETVEVPETTKKAKKPKVERNFNRYIQQVFKKCVPISEVNAKKMSRYSLSSSCVVALNELSEQYLQKVIADWQIYSVKNNKMLVTDTEMAEIIATLWGPHNPRPYAPLTWNLHGFGTKAVELFRASTHETTEPKEMEEEK